MDVNVAKMGRFAVGAAVEKAARLLSKCPGLDSEYRIDARLHGPWPHGPCLWLHGASLGECRMLVGLARKLKEDLPRCPNFLLTSQKAEIVSFLQGECAGLASVAIAPADCPSALTEFVRSVEPLGLVLAENELWPGYLSTLARISTKKNIALVSGRYRRSFPGLNFSGMGLACMQTAADLGRFAKTSKGCVPCVVGGDWKLLSWALGGGSVAVPQEPAVDAAFLSFHQEEMESFVAMAKGGVEKGMSVVLVPRRLSQSVQFRSQMKLAGLSVVDYPSVQPGTVSLVSCFGAVKEILGKSRAAVVGGSFSRKLGIHDFWEPLTMGVETFVGPYAKGHEDLVALLCQERAVTRIRRAEDFLNCRRPSIENAQIFLADEKKKVCDSYSMLLKFLKDLV